MADSALTELHTILSTLEGLGLEERKPLPFEHSPQVPRQAAQIQRDMTLSGEIYKASTGLLPILEQEFDLSIFASEMQMMGYGIYRMDTNNLLQWLVKCAMRSGPEIALSNLKGYLEKEKFPAYYFILLKGTEIGEDDGFDIGADIKLVNPRTFPNEAIRSIVERHNNADDTRSIAALVAPFRHEKKHSDEMDPVVSASKLIPRVKVEDSLRHIHMFSDLKLQYLANGIVPDDTVPWSGNSAYGFADSRYAERQNSETPATRATLELPTTVFKTFQELTKSQKKKIRVPMDKFNDLSLATSNTQKAIDLRTCLESLFLANEKDGEYGYRISLRAALLNGETYDQRTSIRRTVTDVYALGSSAVHTGGFGKMEQRASELLSSGIQIARVGIEKWIASPIDNWVPIELGEADLAASPLTPHS